MHAPAVVGEHGLRSAGPPIRRSVTAADPAIVAHAGSVSVRQPDAPVRRRTCRARATPYDGGVKVSTRGDYASRALLSLALHPTTTARPRCATSPSAPGSPSPTSSRSCWPSRAPGWCAPSGASAAATCWPATGGDHPRRRSSARSTGRSWPATSASPTPTAPATTRASACCWRSGPTWRAHAPLLEAYTLADIATMARGDAAWPGEPIATDGHRPAVRSGSRPGRRQVGGQRRVERDHRRPCRGGRSARSRACRNGRATSGALAGAAVAASPTTGWPIERRCTRIWWVRPVSSRHVEQRDRRRARERRSTS